MPILTNGFSEGHVLKVAYSMLCITSAVVLLRIGLNFVRPKKLNSSDCFVFLSFALYVAKCALYITATPYVHRIYAAYAGETPFYPTILDDTHTMSRMVFAAYCLYWSILWAVKFALLLLYRGLLVGAPRLYIIIWWCITAFCVIVLPPIFYLFFTTCGTPFGFMNGAGCLGMDSYKRQLLCLYFSFVMDTFTNFAIMAFPVWVIWGLQMPRRKKISIMCLFAIGSICVAFACIRVIQVAVNASRPDNRGLPLDPTWLAIWGMVECAIAVIIGCCPALAVLLRVFHSKPAYDPRPTYDPTGYLKQTNSNAESGRGSRMELRDFEHREKQDNNWSCGLKTYDSRWTDAHSSQEELRTVHDGILISTTVTQDAIEQIKTRY